MSVAEVVSILVVYEPSVYIFRLINPKYLIIEKILIFKKYHEANL